MSILQQYTQEYQELEAKNNLSINELVLMQKLKRAIENILRRELR